MGFSFFGTAVPEEKLEASSFQRINEAARILEQDRHGVKVWLLPDGDMLKVFRIKRLITSARIYSYAQRFCRNAMRLKKLDIPTVAPKRLYRFTDSGSSAVLYEPLEGVTLRELAQENKLDEPLLMKLGVFVSKLHGLGVYFRSLHFGNIVVTPQGELGLIDVADMKVFSRKLSWGKRLRNFHHMSRLQEDRASIGLHGWQIIQQNYFENSNISSSCRRKLQSELHCFSAAYGQHLD